MRGRLTHRYLIAFGSNVRVPGIGGPRAVLAAAVRALEREGVAVERVSPIIDSHPMGPSLRRYANAAAVIRSDLPPPSLLSLLQEIENRFGRRRRGQRWRARPLDLDIVLWSGGTWNAPALTIPHPEYRRRHFVVAPAAAAAPAWRDPLTGRSLRHQHTRLTRQRPLPR